MSDPTPEQRAEYLVLRLESLIREGKTDRAMSFKTWQALARAELINAFMDFERKIAVGKQDSIARRLVLVGASTVVTIGFWGTVVAVDHHFGLLAAWMCAGAGILVAGVALEMFLRRMSATYKLIARQKSFERIREFDQQLKQLENELWLKRKRARELREEAEG
ncbi:MAG TPA: hypothetical protein HPQ04_05285 [Rhodospirillaceae bacterium]|nr:hypothetical protein [Rhodospirillaceae bacterium]